MVFFSSFATPIFLVPNQTELPLQATERMLSSGIGALVLLYMVVSPVFVSNFTKPPSVASHKELPFTDIALIQSVGA